jgi:hypothetical protein
MENTIIAKIRQKVGIHPKFDPVNETAISEAEARLGFRLPSILQTIYLNIANGGFGPGYGLIGIKGGSESDYGCIVTTFERLRDDAFQAGEQWPSGLLPFNEWGCNRYSCVDCGHPEAMIYMFCGGDISETGYGIVEFYEAWLNGADLSVNPKSGVGRRSTIINPFTGKPTIVDGF